MPAMTVELGPVVSGYGPSPSPSRTSSQSGPSTPQSPASPFVASRSSSRRSATNSRDTASIDMSERIFEFDCLRLVNAKPGHGLRQRSRSGSSSRTDRSTLSMSPMSPAAGQTSFDHDRSGTWGRSSGSQGNRSRSATSVSADVGLDALGLSSVHTSEKSSKPKKERGTFLRLGGLGGIGQLVNKLELRKKDSSESSEADNVNDCYDGVHGTPQWRKAKIVVRATLDRAAVDCYELDGVSFRLDPARLVSTSISRPHRSLYSMPHTLKISNAPISIHSADTYCAARREPLGPASPNQIHKSNLSLSVLSSPSDENHCPTPTRWHAPKSPFVSTDTGGVLTPTRPLKLRRSTPVEATVPSIPTRTISLSAASKPTSVNETSCDPNISIDSFSTELVFAFPSTRQVHAFTALLESFAPGETIRAPSSAVDTHRRVEFVVGDAILYETGLSSIARRASTSRNRDRSLSGTGPQRLAGLQCVVYLDGCPAAQTSMRADSMTPSWAESFTFEHIPDISRLHIELVYRLEQGQSISLARAEIQMDSWAIGKKHDMKYRLLSTDDGSEVGEIALKMKLDEIIVHGLEQYQSLLADVTNANPTFMDKLASVTTVDGATVSLCRVAIAQGCFKMLLLSLLKLEVQTPSATLFRGNTPLTRTLETVIKMYIGDFLRAALQPALLDICRNEATIDIETSKIPTEQEMRNGDHRMLRALADRLWRDIWATRADFPPFLRILFAALKCSVAKHHQASQKLQYQAISSFLFLRLIGPAIMWPHLSGLLDWMPSPEVMQTLKLVAKPIMNLAFFVEGNERKEGYLALWGPWFKENQSGMSDFLESCSTPQDEYSSRDALSANADVQLFLQARHEAVPESSAVLTGVGSVNLHRELAWLDMAIQDASHRKPSPPSLLAAAMLDERKARRSSDVPVTRRSRLRPKTASTTPSLDDEDTMGADTDSFSLIDSIRSVPPSVASSHSADDDLPGSSPARRGAGGPQMSLGSSRSSKRSIASAQSVHRDLTM